MVKQVLRFTFGDEVPWQERWVGTAVDVVLGADSSGDYGFIVSPHVADPIADAALATHIDSVREYAKRDAQALKMSLNSLYGSFGAPTAVMPPNAHMSVVLLGGRHVPPMRIVSHNYGSVSASPASPASPLIDASKVSPNRRERLRNYRRAYQLPWWRRLRPGSW
jgi:hypothetical protein